MKYIILAGKQGLNKKIGQVFNIENTLRQLLMSKISSSDIYILIDKNSTLKNKLTTKFNIVQISSSKSDRSGLALNKFFKSATIDDNIVVINSDLIFSSQDIDVINDHSDSLNNDIAFVRKPKFVDEKGLKIKVDRSGYIFDDNSELPFYLYYGICIILKQNIKYISGLNTPLIEQLYQTKLVDVDKVTQSGIESNDLVGGSFASLKKSITVKKMAHGNGIDKLNQEIFWLDSLPDSIKARFIPINDYEISDDNSWFEMPYISLPNLRRNFISGLYSHSEITNKFNDILDFTLNELYKKVPSKVSPNWLAINHYDRVFKRLQWIKENNITLSRIIDCKNIYVNETKYINILQGIKTINNSNKIKEIVTPKSLYRIHGDLHFQNILVDDIKNDLIYADPRGELNGSDIFYDFGKLYHSVNAKYDLIHTDISSSSIVEENKILFDYGDKHLEDYYENLKSLLVSCIQDRSVFKDDQNFMLKMEFNEVMHMCSVMIFHLRNDNVENRALSLYAASVKILNEFINKYRSYL